MNIRTATPADFDAIWPVFHTIAAAGETYAYPRDIDRDTAYRLWMERPRQTWVAEENGTLLGTYYLKTNQPGPGAHICNCGYMTSPDARGKGVATAMCRHSKKTALEFGYKAMQFNFVASTNKGAVRLWQKLGFEIVGRLPRAFNHPAHGYVDALVMFQWLENTHE
ncbi:GNAT family N-acetyltransferase [Pontiella agarivorans]|uniref:GNAT family N-acetyltransferase n=1 Tax=Pontiella agarivorans TaxID=3038953 RepID=UPI0032AFFFD5